MNTACGYGRVANEGTTEYTVTQQSEQIVDFCESAFRPVVTRQLFAAWRHDDASELLHSGHFNGLQLQLGSGASLAAAKK